MRKSQLQILVFAITFGCCAHGCLWGQDSAYFNNRYDVLGPNHWDAAISVLTTDSGYVIIGAGGPALYHSNVLVLGLDKQGVIKWSRSFLDVSNYNIPGVSNGSIIMQDGNVLIPGFINFKISSSNDKFLLKMSIDGDSIWYQQYTIAGTGYFAACAETEDGGVAIIGSDDSLDVNGQVVLVKMDSGGNIQWQQRYGNIGGYDNGNVVEGTTDGGYLLGAFSTETGAGNWNHKIWKVDSLGNEEWHRIFGGNYNETGVGVLQHTNGDYYVAYYEVEYELTSTVGGYRPHIARLNNAGDIIWDNTLGSIIETWGVGVQGLKETYDGNMVVCSSDVDRGYLRKVTPSGYSLWDREYNILSNQNAEYFGGFDIANDSGFVVCGFVQPAYLPDTGTEDFWVIKLDSMGCPFAGCDTVTGVIEIDTEHGWAISVYPNPASDYLNVAGNFPLPATLELFDVAGRLVLRTALRTTHQAIGLKALPPGTFIYRLFNDEGLNKTGKIIKQ